MTEATNYLEFDCEHCSRQIRVRRTSAGKRGKCPGCNEIVTVPNHHCLISDDMLANPIAPQANDDAEGAYEQILKLQGGTLYEPEERPTRKIPWFIDIFLYPLDVPGVTAMFLAVGVPFLLRCLGKFLMYTTSVFPPALAFWVAAVIFQWVIFALFLFYMAWYICACIRDSAEGGIRAVDTIAIAPSLPDILMQSWRLLLTILIMLAPALIYLERTRTSDSLFWGLCTLGVAMLPMALLSVVMHESLSGLNPLILLRSVLKTCYLYFPLAALTYAPLLSFYFTCIYLFKFWPLGYLLLLGFYYQMLVLAHLLGCFYKRMEETFYWDV